MTPADDEPLLSLSVAAKQAGLNKSTLSRQVAAGLIRSHSGKVRLSEVLKDRARNVDLTRSRRRTGGIDAVATTDPLHRHATIADATSAIPDPSATSPALNLYTDARSRKEDATARLRQIEYERAIGRLVDVDEVGQQVEAEYAVVRERFMGFPGKLAGKLVGQDRPTIEAMLFDEVCEILNELHGPGAADVGLGAPG